MAASSYMLIAAMYFNENYKRPQAVTKEQIVLIQTGECTPKIISVPIT